MTNPAKENNPRVLEGEHVSLTGTLASMTHEAAYKLVEEHGGTSMHHVSKVTTLLVIGEEGWPLDPDGNPSQKLLHTQELQGDGIDIRILKESDWLNALGLNDQQQDVHRLYTPAMLSQLLNLSVNDIRRWERQGLIKPVKKIYRLPYFDFQQVTSVRRLHELLLEGVTSEEIKAGLQSLKDLVSDIEQPLAQLDLLACDSHLLFRDNNGLIQPASGQRFLDFDPPAASNQEEADESDSVLFKEAEGSETVHPGSQWSADEWFHEGCRLLDNNKPVDAIEAFRIAIMDKPSDPEIHFCLADALYRTGNINGAIERYHNVVESDHHYLEAWTQLGCLYLEKEELNPASDAFRIALDIHPEYPEACWYQAEVFVQLNQVEEAVSLWKQYLVYDQKGPWAEQAHQNIAKYETTPNQ